MAAVVVKENKVAVNVVAIVKREGYDAVHEMNQHHLIPQ